VPWCERRIFAERLCATAAKHGRQTYRLAASLRTLALALGGEAGARLSGQLAVGVSADTLLRRIRARGEAPASPGVRVLGVDEWAYRKGQTYGTILVDLERRRVVDLLPDRSAESFAAWLEEHPGVEVITRDRSGIYAEGASRGAPKAVQVADRWHLVVNLTDAVERALAGRSTLLGRAARVAAPAPAVEVVPVGPVAAKPARPTRAEQAKALSREYRLGRYNEVVALHGRGMSKRQIARTAGLSRQTVVRWLSADRFPERRERPPATSILAPHHAYLERRFAEGCHNAATLCQEIRTQGYAGGQTLVRDYVRRLRQNLPARSQARGFQRPSVRKCAWWLVAGGSELTGERRQYVEALADLCPEIRFMRLLAQEFRRMLREQDVHALGAWVEDARSSLLRRFAHGIHADVAAVRAAIALPWSNGQVEGQVNRLKMLKRHMYGRAHFDLLRERVLLAA